MKYWDIKPEPNTVWGLHTEWKNRIVARQIIHKGKRIEVKS